ncbi:PleD family two-component system response regulator [Devosia sp.]|uniref:PleD family two-component system response regulator n=1 Tax=Devosia sp. TaxID=1871048 RepID=UPI003A8E8F0C
MTARVLIVDDIPTNVRLLEARLSAEYYEVLTASSGREAIEICQAGKVDIVLLDVMMPQMDGFEVCQRLKADRQTHHIPVLMVTALDQPSDKLRGLEVGADDFLTKPVDDVQLMARVRSLVRLKTLTDELRSRAQTGQAIAIEDTWQAAASISTDGGRVLLVDDDARNAQRIAGYLGETAQVDVLSHPQDAALAVSGGEYELVLVSMGLNDIDPLRVCSQMRTAEQSRSLPIILIAEESDRPRVLRGLELGVNDFITRPVERNELQARVRTQLRRQRYAVALRESVSNTLALAVTDELTGLYNRRYFERHLGLMLAKSQDQEREMALMLVDMDYFKTVNDTHGHDVGDRVLREFSDRLRRNIRGIDLACRYGGEEFVVLMPDTEASPARLVAERVRAAVADRPFSGSNGADMNLTVSVGLALNDVAVDTPDTMLKRADVALYQAKRNGRNQVVAAMDHALTANQQAN